MQKIIYSLVALASAAFVSGSDYYLSIPKDFRGISSDDIFNLSFEGFIEVFIFIIFLFLVYMSFKKIKMNKKRISIDLPFESLVTLAILNSDGEEIDIIQREIMKSGKYNFIVDFNHLKNGVYYYQVKAETDEQIFERTLKLVVVK